MENTNVSLPDWSHRFFEKQALSYDDILLVPRRSPVDSRSGVDTSTQITPSVRADAPIISAPMDSITEYEMAEAMADSGGVGIIHRNMSPEEAAESVRKADFQIGGSVGINTGWKERAELLVEAGVDFLCLDVAHGHLENALDVLQQLAVMYPDTDIMAGNVATPEAALDLVSHGADSVKVGIGPGSHCTTREVAGVGVPQFTAVLAVALTLENSPQVPDDITLVADGGIKRSGDITKALMAGADSVMVGSMVGGCDESPAPTVEVDGTKYKRTRGMASSEAKDEDYMEDGGAVEGKEALTEYNGTVDEVLTKNVKGVRSGLSYCGGTSIEEARDAIRKAERESLLGGYKKVTSHTELRNGIHGVKQIISDE